MHKTLMRQLRRSVGIEDAEHLQRFQSALAALALREDIAPDLARGLSGLGDVFERMSATYEQHDRDLALRTRSLELSSVELTAANLQRQA